MGDWNQPNMQMSVTQRNIDFATLKCFDQFIHRNLVVNFEDSPVPFLVTKKKKLQIEHGTC